MTIRIRLNKQHKLKLQQLVTMLKVENQSDVIRQIIIDERNNLNLNRTFLERRGGHPVNLLDGLKNLSSRETRKAVIENYLKQKNIKKLKK